MLLPSRVSALVALGAAGLWSVGCGVKTPLQPVNHRPVVISLTAFPTTIAPGDSAEVVCTATDPDGDPLEYEWFSDGRLRMKDAPRGIGVTRSGTMVVYANPLRIPPADTGWVNCTVHDRRGGGASAGTVLIAIHE